jgi:hypothetical protein
MKIQVFCGIDPKSKQPLFRLEHPFFVNHNQGRIRYSRLERDELGRLRHVSYDAPERVGVHVCKRSGLGIPVRDFTTPGGKPGNTRQTRRAYARAHQYAA